MANGNRIDKALEKYLLERADRNVADNKFIKKSFESIDSDFNSISSNIGVLNKKITAEQNRKLNYKKDYHDVKKDVSNINAKYNKLLAKIRSSTESNLKISNIKIQDQGKELLGEITKTNAKIDRFVKASKQSISQARKEVAEDAQAKIKEIRRKVTNNETKQAKLEETVSELQRSTEDTLKKVIQEKSKDQKKDIEGLTKNLKQIKLLNAERESKIIAEMAKKEAFFEDFKKVFSLEIKRLNLAFEKKNKELTDLKQSISKLSNYNDKKILAEIASLNAKISQVKEYNDSKLWAAITELKKDSAKKPQIVVAKEKQAKKEKEKVPKTPKKKSEVGKKVKNFLFNLFFEEVKEKPKKVEKVKAKKTKKVKKSSSKTQKLEVIQPWSKVEKVKKQN